MSNTNTPTQSTSKKLLAMVCAILAITAAFALSACTGESKAPDSDNAAIPPNAGPLTYSATVTLPYEAGSGYWNCSIADTTKAELVKVEASDFSDDEAKEGKLVMDTFIFSGREAGTTSISFAFNEEGTYSPTDVKCTYEVEVKDDKTMKVTGYEGDDEYEKAFVVNG